MNIGEEFQNRPFRDKKPTAQQADTFGETYLVFNLSLVTSNNARER